MARRSIEQRIGMTLDAITTPVGPLPAPASWADDLCSLQGVNYASLSTATPAGADGGGIGGANDVQAISEFADAWVGDYVAKLQDFVDYYNAQYPSQDGNDTAVLSLRYDLLPSVATCTAPSPNILRSSGDLETGPGAAWTLQPCASTAAKCLSALSGVVLPSPEGPDGVHAQTTDGDAGVSLEPDIGAGVTWLADLGHVAILDAGSADGGAAIGDAAAEGGFGGQSAGPPSAVSQVVTLSAGTYVLSWWDQARDASGKLLTTASAAVQYPVQVLDSHGKSIASFYDFPYVPVPAAPGSGPSLWGTRRVLAVPVIDGGTYTVTFAASSPGDTALGSVAIADVQLEAAQADGTPSTYVASGAAGFAQAYDCPPTGDSVRASFSHNCDGSGVCSYDLNLPFIVDTSQLVSGQAPLSGKLARGNFNYRHGSLAVNLVGTGVHDCANDPTPNCYGSGYVEYDLQHDGTTAGIVGYTGDVRIFDFGRATIHHGKALSAERYVTVPLSSADQALISQPGIDHDEFAGRPLDGAYRVRIWDSPDLDWKRLEDVQIVLQYGYWSQVETGQTATGRPVVRLGHPRRGPIVSR
jgi:hypothetical protein